MMDIIGDKLADVFNPLFSVIYAWIVKPFLELKLFKTLIYGSSEDEDLVFNTFTPDEIEKIVKPGMDVIMILAVFLLLIAIVLAGMKMSSVAINPANRTYIIEFFKDFAIVAILLLNLPTLYSLIFGVNDAIISVFSVAHEDALMEMKETIEPGDDVLGQMIIQLCLLGLFIWGNFYYMMRKLTLVLFMILGPLMAVMLLIPQTKGITIGWLKEFIGTVFVQSVHACLYWVIALMSITESGLEAVILYIIFIPTAEALRSLLGMGGQMSNGLSKAGAMFGMSALAGMYGSVKGAIGDKSVAGALRGAANGIKDSAGRNSGSDSDENTENNVKSTLGGNTGTDTGTNSLAERMLKPGDVTSKMGKMALGMAGSIAGSPMGPAGAIAGSTVGFGVGGVVGGVAGRVGGAGVEGVKLGAKQLAKGAKSGWQNAKDSYNAESLADEKLANELADADTTSWASNNKEQFMEQMKEKFPDAHEESLEGMWSSKVNDKKSDFLKQARQTVGDIKKNDGAFGKAQQVADKATGRLTEAWADNNKEHFMNEYDRNNPITEENDLATHNMNKQASWNNALENKRNEIADLSNETAKSMSNGLPENHAYINKEDFANMVGAKMLNNEKSAFKDQYREQFNPDATDNEIDSQFDQKHGAQREAYVLAAMAAVKGNKPVKASDLVNESTENMTQQWASDNKEQFVSAYQHNNPSASPQEVSEAWEKELSSQKAVFSNVSNKAAKSMTDGNDLSQNIDPNQYAEHVGNELYNSEKTKHVASAPPMSEMQQEKRFDEEHGDKRQQYIQSAKKSVSTDSGVQNAQSLATASADNITKQWADQNKNQFVTTYKQSNPGSSEEEVETAWSNAVKSKRTELGNIANTVASKMTNGKDLSSTNIDSDQFANNVGQQVYDNEKAAYVTTSTSNLQKEFDENNRDKKEQLVQTAKRSISNSQGSPNAQSLASTSAENMTKEWSDNNKGQFITSYKQSNPGKSEAEVEKAWSEAVSGKKQEFVGMTNMVASKMTNGKDPSSTEINPDQFATNLGKQMYDKEKANHVSSTTGTIQKEFDNNFGSTKQDYIQSAKQSIPTKNANQNAQTLATTSADHMTNEWSANNKGQFVTSYKQSNPGKSEEEVEIAWDNASKEKRKEFVSMANSVASKMTNGKDMSSTNISTDQFATNLGQRMYDNEKANYVASAPRKLSNEQIELEFDKQNGSKRVAYVQSAEKAVGNFTKVNASQLANETAENMTNDWANKNQSNFSKNYKVQNPGASPAEVDVAWTKQVDDKRKEMINVTTGLAQKMSNGQSIQNTQLDSKTFAGNLGKELYDNEKMNYRANYKQQASASDQQLEVEFEKGQAGTGRAYFKAARNAVKDVNGAQIYDKSDLSHEVNTPYLVSQLATRATNQEKQKYITEQISNNVPKNVAEENWQTQKAGPTYQRNLKSVSSQLPNRIPLDKRINDGTVKKMVGAGYNGGVHAISSTLELPKITNFAQDTKLGKLAVAGTQGAQAGYQNALLNPPNGVVSKAINPIVGGTSGAMSAMKTSFQEKHVPENAVEKQAGFRNAAAYATGIVGGVRGYKKASTLASKHNPYNRPVNDQIAEVSDIKHLAQQVDDGNGNMEIAKGSVQMVTTNDKSFIQVRDRTGQTRVISRHGSGDSALKEGDTVYQDLTVKDDTLLQDSNPYRYDSTGGKSELNRRINVSPNNLLANRNTRKNPRVVQEVQAYNQQVDSGQFYSNDVQTQMKDLKMVVTKERSYMVGTDSQGQNHRVSPYGAGDARLNPNEARKVNYSVRNRRYNQEDAFDEADESISYTTSLTPDDLIPVKSNKRASRRNDFEAVRHKSLGGTF